MDEFFRVDYPYYKKRIEDIKEGEKTGNHRKEE